MKKMFKRLTIGLILVVSLAAAGQEMPVVTQRSLDNVAQEAFFPLLDQAGKRLLCFNRDVGLMLFDPDIGQTVVVTPGTVITSYTRWGDDGKVYYATRLEGDDGQRVLTYYCYDPATRTTVRLNEPAHGAVWVERDRVHVTVDGTERVFSPVDSRTSYRWPSLSPDGRRVAFYVRHKGVVIIDLRGQMLAMLGDYEWPCWYNEDYLLAQASRPGGRGSEATSLIVLLKADGSERIPLTDPAQKAIQPTCAGGRVVYTTIEGRLHEMTLSIAANGGL